MNKISFETVKKNIAYELSKNPNWGSIVLLSLQDHIERTQIETMLKYGNSYEGYTCDGHSVSVVKKCQKLITDAVMNTDVRCVGKLIQEVKNNRMFPKWLREGNYSIDMNENCEWYLFKNESED